jgi:hypothetical protein
MKHYFCQHMKHQWGGSIVKHYKESMQIFQLDTQQHRTMPRGFQIASYKQKSGP